MENIIYKEHKRTRVLLLKSFLKKVLKFGILFLNTDDKIMLLVFSNDKVYLIDYDGMESLVNIDLKDISNVKEDNFKVKIFFKRVIKERKSSTIKISKTKHLNDNQAHKISLMFKEILGIDDIKCI